MANIKSAVKRMRQTARRAARNRSVRSALRTTLNMKLFERIARKKQPEIDAFVQKVRRALRPPKFGN